MSDGLARLSVVKSAALEKLESTEFDEEIKLLILAASRWANTYTTRTLQASVNTKEQFTGDGTQALYLTETPVNNILELFIWDGSAFTQEDNANFEIIDETYILYPSRGRESAADHGGFPLATNPNVKVSYAYGYDCTGWASKGISDSFGVPHDLELAIARHASLMWKDGKSGGARLGISSLTRFNESMTVDTFSKDLPPDVKLIYNSYRRFL